jgi:predicted kinase
MTGHLVILTGIPGSGKTRLAQHLAQQYDYFVLSRDLIKRATFGNLDTGIPQNHIAFTAMQYALPILLNGEKNVILDGMPFNRVGQSEIMEAIADDVATPRITLYLTLLPEVAAKRLSVPDPTAPADRRPELPHIVHRSFRPIPDHWIHINADMPPTELDALAISIITQNLTS